jgi:hypothetical protein
LVDEFRMDHNAAFGDSIGLVPDAKSELTLA